MPWRGHIQLHRSKNKYHRWYDLPWCDYASLLIVIIFMTWCISGNNFSPSSGLFWPPLILHRLETYDKMSSLAHYPGQNYCHVWKKQVWASHCAAEKDRALTRGWMKPKSMWLIHVNCCPLVLVPQLSLLCWYTRFRAPPLRPGDESPVSMRRQLQTPAASRLHTAVTSGPDTAKEWGSGGGDHTYNKSPCYPLPFNPLAEFGQY